MIGLTKSAAVEYAPKGIRINAVCPGVIETPMVADMLEGQAEAMAAIMSEQPIGRLGQAKEVAAAALWLCSPGASFVIGVALPVDGGCTTRLEPGRPAGGASQGAVGARGERPSECRHSDWCRY